MAGNPTKCSNINIPQTVLSLCILIVQIGAFSLQNCTVQDETFQLKVLCYKMGFFKVPADIPNKVKYLDISFNSISEIQVKDFEDIWNLSHLNSSNNHISNIQDGTSQHFPNLTNLNLAHNRLKKLSGGLLQGLTKLQVLRLDDNAIESIDPHAFNTLSSLKVLNLTKNKLKQIHRVQPVLASPSLKELLVGSNRFDTFNSYDLSRRSLTVTKMDFSNNPLTTFQITDNIFPVLDYLDMSNCGKNTSMMWNITDKAFLNSVRTLNLSGVDIPGESITALLQNSSWASLNKLRLNEMKGVKVEALLQAACSPKLNVLRLKGNKISKLTNYMFQHCFNLTELDLATNEISIVSAPVFKGLTQLRKLQLQLNRLSHVNNSFQLIPTLEFIDLSRNRIHKLNCSDFANLTLLTHLYLYGNRISEIRSCLFKNLQHLEILKLGTNQLLTIGSTFEHGPQSLRELQLTYNKLSAVTNGTFKSLSNLRVLDMSNNQIFEIKGQAFSGLINLAKLLLSSNRITADTIKDPKVFLGMPNLKLLELYSNFIKYRETTLHLPPFEHLKSLKIMSIHSQRRGIGKIPSNLLQGLTSLNMFYGGSMNLQYLHPDTFNSTLKLWFLDLSKNAFGNEQSISAEVFHPIQRLTKLILKRSQLHSLNFLLDANLSRLSVLRASENTLDVINKTLIQSLPRLRYLDLEKNTFTCDCSNAFFIDWAMKNNTTQIVYLSKYACSYPPSLRGTYLADLNTDSCNVNVDFICFVCSSAVVIITLLVSFIYHFLYWQVIYAYYLFLAFLYDSKKKQMRHQHEFQYDAFISYNAQDEPWVVEELVPNLEDEQGWRLCLHYRDFEPGRPIIDNIMDGIYSSRKTICLITHNYLRSNWCSKEIQMANFRLFNDQKDVLILVFLEDIPTCHLSPYYQMRKLVKKKTYLKWPKPGDDARIFWQKMRQALETKEDPDKQNIILSGEECRLTSRIL
ncbi:toll-like receptor 22 [Pygocentrus nattereri]|uniref:TIR domain-containing protein n=1 Tax=Pygocentrus nattereri TaxID=42514 RepID=A0A3B4CF45_PYGNA|nr:toll-like receptor 22 [Pygocentrus nattereri]XP_017559872.1 toll-like receptor 22 [Pygocentrus nattereri]